MRSRTYATGGAERACRPATARRPLFFASAARISASFRPLPQGHSQYTALPASSAGLERDIPGQSPVLAVDRRVRAEARVHAAHRILRLTGVHDVQGDRPRQVPDREVARHLVLIVSRALDARALERDGLELLDV